MVAGNSSRVFLLSDLLLCSKSIRLCKRVSRKSLDNAEKIIDLEKSIGTFKELQIQDFFIDWKWFIQFWNIFYGTFHFGVTIFALVWLYIKFPKIYPTQRFFLLSSTGTALIGFSLFPLMPPRLLSNCGEFGACLTNKYPFVDTLSEIGGLWSFDSGTCLLYTSPSPRD